MEEGGGDSLTLGSWLMLVVLVYSGDTTDYTEMVRWSPAGGWTGHTEWAWPGWLQLTRNIPTMQCHLTTSHSPPVLPPAPLKLSK